MAPSYATSLKASTVDKIASTELKRFRLLYLDKLVIESIDVSSTFAQGTEVLELAPSRRLKTVKMPKLLIISGSRGFANLCLGKTRVGVSQRTDPLFLLKLSRQVRKSWTCLR